MTQTTTAPSRIPIRLPDPPESYPLARRGSNVRTPIPKARTSDNSAESIAPIVENMARMNFAATQVQHQAMQASNLATAKTLEAIEKTQDSLEALTEENAELRAEIVVLKALVSKIEQSFQLQIQALTEQNAATQQHVMNVNQKLVSVEDDYKTHHHVLRRGTVTVKYNGEPETHENAPTRVTGKASHEEIPKDHDGCLVQ